MFKHHHFDTYSFEDIPLNRDIFLMDEKYMGEYEEMFLKFFGGEPFENIGEVGFFAARAVNKNSVEMSWYPNIFTRFHEVAVSLPRSEFLCCVGSWHCDEKPRIFVKANWLESLYLRSYSIFGLVDAIGVKKSLENGDISREKLICLRNEIDILSAKYPEISFISFADSLLLKSNWTTDFHEKNIKDNYHPEQFIYLAKQLNEIYQNILGLHTYTIIAQGSNEYYDDSLLHISESGNHISLNSLGIPFAQLQSIENSARRAIRSKNHEPAELYLDELYFHSLQFRFGFKKHDELNSEYKTKIKSVTSKYYLTSIDHIIKQLAN